jgi:hypothetical protein
MRKIEWINSERDMENGRGKGRTKWLQQAVDAIRDDVAKLPQAKAMRITYTVECCVNPEDAPEHWVWERLSAL